MTLKNEHPNPMITYYALDFAYHRFRSHDESDIADEIGLDPRYWGPPCIDIGNLSTLVHEMTHLWQHHYGRPSYGDYHNREFARKMFEVGLITSKSGAKGGKSTGSGMSHHIKPCGRRIANQISSQLEFRAAI
jgi:hypothetical protein